MYCNYETSSGKLYTWIDLDYIKGISTADVVGINGEHLPDEIRCPMYMKDGKMRFEFKGEEVDVTSCEVMTMEQIRESMKESRVRQDDFQLAIISDGIENVRFEIEASVPDFVIGSFAVCGNKKLKTACRIRPEYNHMPHGGYKLCLVAVEESDGYGCTCCERYYISDMISLIKCGQIGILDSIKDGKSAKEHFQDYITMVVNKSYFK